MMKYVLYITFLGIMFPWNETFAKASSEVEGYACEEQADKRVYCYYEKSRKPVTGKIKKRQEGYYSSIENFSKGYRDGLNTFFDGDGYVRERVYYKQGLKNGIDKIYYENRTIKSIAEYNEGILEGQVDVYSEDGKLLGRMKYKRGKLEHGYCINSQGKREKFSLEFMKKQQENQLVTCGAE